MSLSKFTRSCIAAFIVLALITGCGGTEDPPNIPVDPSPPPIPPGPVVPPPPTPFITSISSNAGTYRGGTTVELGGMNFETDTTVVFDKTAAHVMSATATKITVTTPAHAVGVVDITVTNTSGKTSTFAGGFTFTKSRLEAAEDIMGKNFVGPKELALFGITLTPDEEVKCADVYFAESTLIAKKDTHILVLFHPGPSIADLRAMMPPGTIEYCSPWTASQIFTNDTGGNGRWALVQKTLLANSQNLPESEQVKLFASGSEYMPSVREYVYTLLAYYVKTGEVLIPGVFGRTRTYTYPGTGNIDPLYVGGNAYGGAFGICSGPAVERNPSIGIGSEWLSRYTY